MKNQGIKKLRLDRVYPKDLQSHFVSNIVVQHQQDFFVLSFFEVWPPIILADSDEETVKLLDSIASVEAKCVTRLVVTPQKMREFVEVMTENLRQFELVFEQSEDLLTEE